MVETLSPPVDPVLDAPIAVTRYGEGPRRVLLLHSIGLGRFSWSRVAPRLQGCEVVAADLPGHGDSGKPVEANYRIRPLARRIERLLDELSWDDALIAGNSLGGGTALALAIASPERVRGLALLNSVAFRDGLPLLGRLFSALPRIPAVVDVMQVINYAPLPVISLGMHAARRRRSVSRDDCEAVQRYLGDPVGRRTFFATLQELYSDELDQLADGYRRIRCPSLVLHGAADPMIRLSHAERLSRELPGAELVTIPNCGHFPQEECPDETAAALQRFIDRVAPVS